MRRQPVLLLGVMAFGYAFLYLPIALMVVLSFNESRLVTVWTGFSLRWYEELFRNDALVRSAWLSLRIALVSATGATILGTLAGFALARFGRFTGRWLFAGLIAAPLVMPDVITGISLLLLFVSLLPCPASTPPSPPPRIPFSSSSSYSPAPAHQPVRQ